MDFRFSAQRCMPLILQPVFAQGGNTDVSEKEETELSASPSVAASLNLVYQYLRCHSVGVIRGTGTWVIWPTMNMALPL